VKRSAGFSLFEVLISLAIFGGAILVLSSYVDTGVAAAARARDLSRAQMLCEAKLEELMLQSTIPVSIPETAMESGELGVVWSYQVDVVPAMAQGLHAVRVTIRAAPPGLWSGKESYFSLIRWMADPALTAADSTEPTTTTEPTP
jgi:general secretion pathway protein I